MMEEEKIDQIIQDYVNSSLNETEFSVIKNQFPEIDWDTLVKEEKFYRNIFQAKVYDRLHEKINSDISRIEKRKTTLKYGVGLLLFATSIGTAVYFYAPHSENIKRENIEISHVSKIDSISIEQTEIDTANLSPKTYPKEDLKPSSIPKKISEHKTTPPELAPIFPEKGNYIPVLNSKTEEKKILKKDSLKPEIQKTIEKEKKEFQATQNPENQELEKSKPRVQTKNYILNPTMNESLELPSFDLECIFYVKTLAGKTLFEERIPKNEALIWKGQNQNQEKLSVGLYLYMIEQASTTIQFGQITITE